MFQLQLFETYEHFVTSIEQQLQNREFPMLLFKNITKRKDVKEKIFCTTQSTFIIVLRTDAAQSLKKITSSTNVVSI